MRGLIVLLAVVLAVPTLAALVPFPPVEHWDLPPGAAALLTPPNPAVQSWPSYAQPGAPLPSPGPAQTTGVARALILLIRFTDIAPDATHDGAYYNGRLNAVGGSARSLRSYYQEVSLGALTVNATIISTWWPSTRTMAYYGQDGASGVDNANGPIYRLVIEAVKAADPTVDFAPFDTNGDGVVDHLIVVHAGSGQETNANSPDLIWSHRWAVLDADPFVPGSQSLTADGVQVYGYMMISEDFALGVVTHEFGHDLGLPDLYDTDGSSQGAGLWDIMAGGSWNGIPAGSSPAHMSAWSLLRLGWVTPTDVTTSLVGTAVDAVESSGKVFRLTVAGPLEYFLVENRQPIGTDAALPGSGLLVWHVDDSRSSNDQDDHRLLDLEEADQGVSGDRPSDAGDPWHDTPAGWGPDTTPDSRAYDGSATGWRIRDISASGATMIATIARDVTKDLAVSAIRLPFMEAAGTRVPVEVDVRNEGVRSANLTLQVDVYRDTLQPAARVTGASYAGTGVAQQTTVTYRLNFTPASTGRYIVHAALVRADDEIPSNDERAAHVLVNTFRFRDDVESGVNGWTTNEVSTDTHRWHIVTETDPDGAAHSRPSSWRFGYLLTLLPNPFPPAWHTLTSTAISVSPGPTFLIFYQRHDLTGRTLPVVPIGANDTDEAYVEVRYGSGLWIPLARYTGRDLTWRSASYNLTANITGPTTLQVRFNASSNVMGNSGGWWIDDVMIASVGLGRAAVLFGPDAAVEGPAGGMARFDAKLVNLGDYETDFRLDAILPAGWDASLEGGSGGTLRGRVVRLAPDNDAALRIALSVPSSASSGATYPVTISTTAVGDPTPSASITFQVRVAGGLPLELLIPIVLIVAAIVILAIVVALRRRRPRS